MGCKNLWLANEIRDAMNDILARYDVPSTVYEQDVDIDAACVCLADKALARAEAAEAEVEGLRPWAMLGHAVVSDWPDIEEVDGFELEALAEKHGVLYRAPGGYDPERHHDYFSIELEPGEEWFEMIEPPHAALRNGEAGDG